VANLDEVGAASVDYLMVGGYVTLAYTWARLAKVADEQLKGNPPDAAFYRAKLVTADFYFERLLPRAISHTVTAKAGATTLMALTPDDFSLN